MAAALDEFGCALPRRGPDQANAAPCSIARSARGRRGWRQASGRDRVTGP